MLNRNFVLGRPANSTSTSKSRLSVFPTRKSRLQLDFHIWMHQDFANPQIETKTWYRYREQLVRPVEPVTVTAAPTGNQLSAACWQRCRRQGRSLDITTNIHAESMIKAWGPSLCKTTRSLHIVASALAPNMLQNILYMLRTGMGWSWIGQFKTGQPSCHSSK